MQPVQCLCHLQVHDLTVVVWCSWWSPRWDAVAKSRAAADAEERGHVWDGKLIMVPMPDNPRIQTMASDKLSVVGKGMQGTVL